MLYYVFSVAQVARLYAEMHFTVFRKFGSKLQGNWIASVSRSKLDGHLHSGDTGNNWTRISSGYGVKPSNRFGVLTFCTTLCFTAIVTHSKKSFPFILRVSYLPSIFHCCNKSILIVVLEYFVRLCFITSILLLWGILFNDIFKFIED